MLYWKGVQLLWLWCVVACPHVVFSDMELYGLGASLPGEVYDAWTPAFENYRNRFVELNTEYTAAGSGAGKLTITGKLSTAEVTYVGTDSVLSEQEHADNPDLQMVPILGAAVVLSYNLMVISDLNLTAQHLVGIYNGTYRWWNDTSIQDVNPRATMPSNRIRVVARADDSGTTEIFTSALCTFDENWNRTYGKFSEGLDDFDEPVHWNESAVELYGRTNRGVSGIVLSYRYSVGYLSVADAQVAQVKYAKLISSSGQVMDVEPDQLMAAMDRTTEFLSPRLTANLIDFVEEDEYPIIGYSYFIVNMHEMTDCDLAMELVRYLEWIIEDDFTREEIRDFKMAPLPVSIADVVTEEVLMEMTCDGNDLYEMVQKQTYEEWLSTQTWRKPVALAMIIFGLIVLALVTYMIVQQVRLRRAMNSDDWKIDSDSINLKWSKKWGIVGTGQTSAISLTASAISHVTLTQVGGHLMGVGIWAGKPVCLRDIRLPYISASNREVQRTLLWMRYKVQHNNVLKLFGISRIDNEAFFVSEHAQKGTLSDVIQNDKYPIDDNIKFSLAIDVTNGMSYLHGQGLLHGCLKSECCYLDQRWNVKVADWENARLQEVNKVKKMSKVTPVDVDGIEEPNIAARHLYWTDPELLRSGPNHHDLERYMDVYSCSIILVEIFTREDPYSERDSMTPTEIIDAIKEKDLRPDVAKITPTAIKPIIIHSWDPDPEKRPSFAQLKKSLRTSKPSKKSVMDSMMEALEGYVNQLEEKDSERTAELATANKSLENLLHQILPPSVADSLSKGESVQPESFESVTIFFSDIVGFTKLSAASAPMEIVTMLNDLYTTFDSVIDNHDVYKVETIGDAYMVISGLPTRNGDLHASHVATMALDLLAAATRFRVRHRPRDKLQLRAGIHTGSVVAGVVGIKMPRYCLFGDTVNTASRMESTSLAMKIQVSQTTEDLLTKLGGFRLELRGETEVKGKGKIKTFFLEGKDGYTPLPSSGSYCLQFLHNE